RVRTVLRRFKWASAADARDVGPSTPRFDDSTWKATDVAVDSWSALGLHDWFHSVWYRARFDAHRPKHDRSHVFLWLGGGDGAFRVFVNGREASFVARPGSPNKPEG